MGSGKQDVYIDKLRGHENYYDWKIAMKNVLEFNNLDGGLDETEKDAGKLKKCKNLLMLKLIPRCINSWKTKLLRRGSGAN